MFLPNKNKRALSNIVAYVLLIAITISLSVLVYNWLRFYVGAEDVETCSDNVNLVIRSYECFLPDDFTGENGSITVTLKNRGFFTVDGYELRVHDRPGADFGFYLLNDTGTEIAPGDEHEDTYYFSDPENFQEGDVVGVIDKQLSIVTLVEVQPFVKEGDNIRCKSYASQEVVCQKQPL